MIYAAFPHQGVNGYLCYMEMGTTPAMAIRVKLTLSRLYKPEGTRRSREV
jgi:hypothetical protein